MNAVAELITWISPEEYLESEVHREIRHEYVAGRIFAMAGSSKDHNRIAGNLFAALHANLRGKRCEPFTHDMKARIPLPSDVFYYPDVMVVCDPEDDAEYFRTRPSHVFEVISPATESTDRREKALAYRAVPGIKCYVVLEQEEIQATIMRPAETGWETEVLQGPDAILSLPDLDFKAPLALLYERTALVEPKDTL